MRLSCTGGSVEVSLLGTQYVCVCRVGRPGWEKRLKGLIGSGGFLAGNRLQEVRRERWSVEASGRSEVRINL